MVLCRNHISSSWRGRFAPRQRGCGRVVRLLSGSAPSNTRIELTVGLARKRAALRAADARFVRYRHVLEKDTNGIRKLIDAFFEQDYK
jgi:hypothetical protein